MKKHKQTCKMFLPISNFILKLKYALSWFKSLRLFSGKMGSHKNETSLIIIIMKHLRNLLQKMVIKIRPKTQSLTLVIIHKIVIWLAKLGHFLVYTTAFNVSTVSTFKNTYIKNLIFFQNVEALKNSTEDTIVNFGHHSQNNYLTSKAGTPLSVNRSSKIHQ